MDKGAMNNGKTTLRNRLQAGNAIVMLFAAIGMAGVVTYGLNNVIRGPAVTTAEVSRRTIAENNLVATTRLAINAAARQQTNNGDCDGDGFVEPMPFRDAGVNPHPAGGGYVPSTMGASMADPWGNQYGYCVWDPGTVSVSNAVADCGGATPRRLQGAPRDDQYAIAVISAGKNGAFETECNAYVDANTDNVPDDVMVDKPAGSDDVVLAYSYAEANGIGGGEWKLKPTDDSIAQIGKNVAIGSASQPRGAAFDGSLNLGGERGLVLPRDPGDDSVTGPCTADKENQMRLNVGDGSEIPVLEICYGSAWVMVSGGSSAGGTCVPQYDTWTAQASGTDDWEQISLSADGETMAAIDGGTSPVHYSHDGGVTWQNGNVSRQFVDVTVSADGNTMYASAEAAGSGVYKSVDGGVTWAATSAPAVGYYNIDSSDDGTVIAVVTAGGGNRIQVSTDSGATWNARGPTMTNWYDIVVSADGSDMTAIPYNDVMQTSSDSGTTWTPRGVSRFWGSVAMSDDGTRQAATVLGDAIYISTDGGATWSPSSSGNQNNWWELSMSADGMRIVATVDGGAIHVSEDGGATWSVHGATQVWYGIDSSSDGTKIAAVVNGGVIYTSDPDCSGTGGPGGTCGDLTWSVVGPSAAFASSDISNDGQTIVASASNDIGNGGVYTSLNGGGTWNLVDAAGSFAGTSVAVSNDGQVMISAEWNEPLRYSTNSGSSWTDSDTTAWWSGAALSGDGGEGLASQYSGGTNDSAHRSTDSGATWTTGVTTYSGSYNDVALSANGLTGFFSAFPGVDRTTDGGVTWTNVLGDLDDFLAVATSDNGSIVAVGTSGGRVWVSTNGGTAWTERTSIPAAAWWNVGVSPDGGIIGAAGPDGVYLSTDNGVTWTQQTSLTGDYGSIAISEDGDKIVVTSNPDILIGSCSGGGVTTTQQQPTAQPHPLDEGLLAYWRMDEGTGTTVADSVGDHDGTFEGTPEWTTTGPVGTSSLSFKANISGDRDGVVVPTDFGTLDEGTVSLWVNIRSLDTSGSELFNLGDYIILRQEADSLRYYFVVDDLPTAGRSVSLVGAGWHYVTATFNSTTGFFRLYIDGYLLDQFDAGAPVSLTANHDFIRIGKHVFITGDFGLRGGIDDVRLYSRALGPLEVQQLYQRSQGGSEVRKTMPPATLLGKSNILTTSGIGLHACAIKDDGSTWCWGNNGQGRLGISSSTITDVNVPTKVQQQSIQGFRQISAGRQHTCGVTADNTGWCWGDDAVGQRGDGATTTGNAVVPMAVTGGAVWSQISAGYAHTCGIRTNGTLWCWGDDTSQQLGNGGGVTSSATPVAIGSALYTKVDSGYAHSCAIRTDGSLWCWGRGNEGQIGDGANSTRNTPTAVVSNRKWKDVSVESTMTCGVTTDGTSFCWGNGAYNVPYRLISGDTWEDVDIGNNHLCILRTDGSLWCSGDDSNGQLGNGSITGPQSIPQRVPLPGPVVAFSAGNEQTCAMEANGMLWCWGLDNTGSLGNGATTADQVSPDRVVGFPVVSPFLWNSTANSFGLNGSMTIALGNDKWISDDGTAKYFGFESAGKARLRQTGSSNQLLVETAAATNSSQVAFKKGTVSPAPSDFRTSLTAEWLFDEAAGATASSNTGSFPGTLSGTTSWNQTGGRVPTNGVLEFDGVTGRASVANHASLRPAATFTITFWVRPDGVQTTDATILTKSFNNGAGNSYAFRVNSDGYLNFETYHTGALTNTMLSATKLRVNSWNFVHALVVDAGGGLRAKALKVNTVASPSITGLPALSYSTDATGNLFFGSGGCVGVCNPFRGAIDDVRLYTAGYTANGLYDFQTTGIVPKAIGIDHGTNNLEIGTTNATATNFLNTISPDLALTSTGNVGLGTASPAAKVDVSGSARVGYQSSCSAGGAGAIRYTGNTGDEAPVTFCSGAGWTTPGLNLSNNAWNNIVYANDRFLTVTGSLLGYSLDGVNWTETSIPSSSNLQVSTYGGGVYVLLGGTIHTSSDGINWTQRTNPSGQTVFSAAYGNGVFVGVGANGARVYSTDYGVTWNNGTPLEAFPVTSVTYGNGLFVSVSNNGTNRVATSTDGINWTPRTAAGAYTWWSVTYGNGLYVAVAQTGDIMTSPDGITWTLRSSPAANTWTGISYGGGLFVAVGQTGTQRVMTSRDGVTWTLQNAAAANNWLSPAYGQGRWLAVAWTGTNDRLMSSACTTTSTVPGTASLPGGAIGYWKFDETSGATASDSAGTNPGTLTGNAAFTTGYKGNAVTFDGVGDYVNMGSAANLDNLSAVTACAWVNRPSGQVSANQAIVGKADDNGAYGWSMWTGMETGSNPGDFGGQGRGNGQPVLEKNQVVPANTWKHICSSWDGTLPQSSMRLYVDGTELTSPWEVSGSGSSTTSDASYNLVVGNSGSGATETYVGLIDEVVLYNRVLTASEVGQVMAATSDTAQTTYSCSATSPTWAGVANTTSTWVSVAYGNGTWVAIGASGANRVMTSPDGINWTPRTAAAANSWQRVRFGNGLFVAVSYDGTNRIMTSPDGITWTSRSAPEANGWRGLAYGNGTWVGVANSGTNRVMTSPDGITWTARAAAEANSWQNVSFGDGLFVSVSFDGTNRIMTSPDGITWTARAAPEANSWRNAVYGNGIWVAVATTGTNRVMTSSDGAFWTARAAAEPNQWWGVTYGGGRFVAIASSGTNRAMTSTDGINWTASTGVPANQFWDVAYGNGRFVAVAEDNADRVATTTCPTVDVFQYCDGTRWNNFVSSGASTVTWKRSSVSIDPGDGQTCGIKNDGTAWCWGYDADGQLGNGGTSADVASPVAVTGSTNTWRSISGGAMHSCGIQGNGTGWCWGEDASGQLGNFVTAGDQQSPSAVSGLGSWAKISAGSSEHTCGIQTDGTLWCWGWDFYGQLGNGGAVTANQTAPYQVGTARWVDVSAGAYHSCGIQVDGTAWCWGRDNWGQVGNGGTLTDVDAPALVTGGGTWAKISAGAGFTCGIKMDGTAWCWGNDDNEQLGSLTVGNQPSPVQVIGTGPWTDIGVGEGHSCGLKTGGTAWCWGQDDNGQLGNGAGTTGDQDTPTQVTGTGTWVSINGGFAHTCGAKSDGTLWCWGSDSNGQVGNGATTGNQPDPVRVP